MSTKFFNNTGGNTLFEKLKGIAGNMANFDRFLAVSGYFRSSGYFKLRAELNDVKETNSSPTWGRIDAGQRKDNLSPTWG